MEKPKFAFEKDLTTNSEILTKTQCKVEDLTESKLIKDFGSYTTLHGFHFIFDSGTTPRRLFWFCLMVFGFAALITQVFFNICRLNSNETKIRKSIELSSNLKFPAVTICNQNMLKKSKIEGTKAQDYLDQLDVIKLGLRNQKKVNVPPFDIEKVVQESGHHVREMINECVFTHEYCSWKNFTRTVTSSFSTLELLYEYLRASKRVGYSILGTEYRRIESYGNCYTFNAGNNGSSILSVSAPGKMQSLSLRLDSEPHEYYGPFSYDGTGFKLAVHDQGTYVDVEEEGYDISPGFYTSIRIKKNKEISLPPPYHSMCGSRELINFKQYSYASCLHECISKLVAKECNCRVLSMVKKGINVTRFCSSDEIKSCIYPAYRQDKTFCDCPQECKSISYKVQLSSAYYPSEHLWDTILPLMYNFTGWNASIPEQREKLQSFVRKRYGMVSVFFQTLDTDVVEETPAYTLTNFWSDIGGNMGLFLGCSMMTVCEFIDLMFIIFLKKWRKGQERAKKCQVESSRPTS